MRFTAVFSTALALAAGANAADMAASEVVKNVNAIADISSDANDIAKSISVTNVYQTTPQVVNDFKQIIDTVSKDITAMNAKRDLPAAGDVVKSLKARQECLDVTDVEKCIEDLGDIAGDPSEILGRDGPAVGEIVGNPGQILGGRKRQAADYTGLEQSQVCDSFRGFVQTHKALLNTLIEKHGLLSLTPYTRTITSILKTLEQGVDVLAFSIIDLVPNCAEDAIDDKNNLDSTLEEALEKYA